MRLTLCTLFNMNYHFLNTYYYCVHFSNYIVLFLSLLHEDAQAHVGKSGGAHVQPRPCTPTHTYTRMSLRRRVLMRSNKDGNDPVLFPSPFLSLLLSLSLSLSLHPFPLLPVSGTQLFVYMEPI